MSVSVLLWDGNEGGYILSGKHNFKMAPPEETREHFVMTGKGQERRGGDQWIFDYLIFVVIVLSLRVTSYSVEVLYRVTLVK